MQEEDWNKHLSRRPGPSVGNGTKEFRSFVVNIKLDKVKHINYTQVRKGSSPIFPQVAQNINSIEKWKVELHKDPAQVLR